VKRSGWKGVDSPVSTPDEFVYDYRQTFGTKRTGPDLSRIGGKYDKEWHRAHFRNPRDLVPGSIMPPFPWIADNPEELDAWWPTCRRAAAPRTGGRITTTRSEARR
jgi:cytochrome c oxidase cbb3-type subunit 2